MSTLDTIVMARTVVPHRREALCLHYILVNVPRRVHYGIYCMRGRSRQQIQHSAMPRAVFASRPRQVMSHKPFPSDPIPADLLEGHNPNLVCIDFSDV